MQYGWEISEQSIKHDAKVERTQRETIRTIQSLAQELKTPLGALRGIRLTDEGSETVTFRLINYVVF